MNPKAVNKHSTYTHTHTHIHTYIYFGEHPRFHNSRTCPLWLLPVYWGPCIFFWTHTHTHSRREWCRTNALERWCNERSQSRKQSVWLSVCVCERESVYTASPLISYSSTPALLCNSSFASSSEELVCFSRVRHYIIWLGTRGGEDVTKIQLSIHHGPREEDGEMEAWMDEMVSKWVSWPWDKPFLKIVGII